MHCLHKLWSEIHLDSSAGSATSYQGGLGKLCEVLGPQFNHLSNGNDNGTIFMGYLGDSKTCEAFGTDTGT